MNDILSGAAMGAALTVAGVYAPDVILTQFNFTDFTMLQTFLTAAAGSSLIVTASQTLGLTSLPPRRPASLGFLSKYDGNIFGGALLGAGMAVSGACPGTVLAQLGVGVTSGRWALAGGLLAGVAWSWISSWSSSSSSGCSQEGNRDQKAADEKAGDGDGLGKGGDKSRPAETVHEAFGVNRAVALVGLEAVLILVIATVAKLTTSGASVARGITPYAGGLAIAASQLVSILLRRSLIGTSTAFEELGGWVWGAKKYTNVLFSAGVVSGAWAISQAVPALRPVTEASISPVRSLLGGFMIVFGARVAGGCTSGHGISGLSLLSISSFLTAAAIFGAGGITGLLLE
ncbi:uncharacterized protein C8A04DRAFT_38320 [Dichotomopilus funicola]|uniref:Sulphur transport domain-containing protein n=1 Tax=Dichotomopilus funicola TaxID=1934379 RepID=A0AAN6V004_9PEZI|nr:hypothetical protein C8A04DRAFT_38320 [Dichotomopilus funicola]